MRRIWLRAAADLLLAVLGMAGVVMFWLVAMPWIAAWAGGLP